MFPDDPALIVEPVPALFDLNQIGLSSREASVFQFVSLRNEAGTFIHGASDLFREFSVYVSRPRMGLGRTPLCWNHSIADLFEGFLRIARVIPYLWPGSVGALLFRYTLAFPELPALTIGRVWQAEALRCVLADLQTRLDRPHAVRLGRIGLRRLLPVILCVITCQCRFFVKLLTLQGTFRKLSCLTRVGIGQFLIFDRLALQATLLRPGRSTGRLHAEACTYSGIDLLEQAVFGA